MEKVARAPLFVGSRIEPGEIFEEMLKAPLAKADSSSLIEGIEIVTFTQPPVDLLEANLHKMFEVLHQGSELELFNEAPFALFAVKHVPIAP